MPLLLAVLLPRPVMAQQTPAQAMAHAIARMMESMGFTGHVGQDGIAPAPAPTDPAGLSSWPSTWGQLPQSAPVSPDRAAQQAGALADSAWRAMQGSGMPGGVSLEGIWEDNQGGLLIVQGRFYRLYSACRGSLDGEIRVQADRLELSNPAEHFTQIFEFALDQGRLALRDQNGRLYLYRRLFLNPEAAR